MATAQQQVEQAANAVGATVQRVSLDKIAEQKFRGPAEWHTTDLSEPCRKRVQLRLLGRIDGETAGALWLGNAVHAAMELLWVHDDFAAIDEARIEQLCVRASHAADRKAKEEGRPLSFSMQPGGNQETRIEQEKLLRSIVTNYTAAMTPLRGEMQVLGIEVPIRCTLEIDGEPTHFATHADLVWRDKKGQLHIDDFKTQDECPTRSYLARWVQGACMFVWTRNGTMTLDTPDFGIMPLCMDEFPVVRWVHMRNFLPYKRSTTVTEDGVRCTYAAGEARPLSKCILYPNFEPAFEARIVHHLCELVRMGRAGIWARTPNSQACHYCDSRNHCLSFGGFGNDTI